jgi:iron complex outermembrane recepter protein
LSNESKYGVFRTGIWFDWAYTDRYQIPSNIVTHLDTPFPNFHEHFITTSVQPFAEYEWHAAPKFVVTVGVKAADYGMALNQYQDNGKTVGCLGGTLGKDPGTGAPICIGGAKFVTHSINYNNWLPNIAARYSLKSTLVGLRPVGRGQYHSAEQRLRRSGRECDDSPQTDPGKDLSGRLRNEVPPLDSGCRRLLHPLPERLRQLYRSRPPPNPSMSRPGQAIPKVSKRKPASYSLMDSLCTPTAAWVRRSIRADRTIPTVANGWQDAPKNIETVSLLWHHTDWSAGLVDKRVGTMYNDNATLNYIINGISIPFPVDQAYTINPFNIVNVFANYTVKGSSFLRGSKIGLAVNNLANSHNLVGITPAIAPTPCPRPTRRVRTMC